MSDEQQALTPDTASPTASLTEAFNQSLTQDVAAPVVDTTPSAPVDPETPVEAAATEPAPVDTPGEPDAEKLPFHEHPRWKEVMAERDALKAQVEQSAPQTALAQQIIEQFGSIENYNQALADANRQAAQAQITASEDQIRAEVQAMLEDGELGEKGAKTLLESRLEAFKLQQRNQQLEPAAQTLQQQQAQAQAEKRVTAQLADLTAKYPDADIHAISLALYQGNPNVEQFARESHERVQARIAEAENKYKLAQRNGTPTPVGANPGMAPAGQAGFDALNPPSLRDLFR